MFYTVTQEITVLEESPVKEKVSKTSKTPEELAKEVELANRIIQACTICHPDMVSPPWPFDIRLGYSPEFPDQLLVFQYKTEFCIECRNLIGFREVFFPDNLFSVFEMWIELCPTTSTNTMEFKILTMKSRNIPSAFIQILSK